MADTLFSQGVTIASTWLNAVNNWVYQGKNPNYVTSTGAANTYTVTIPATSLLSALVAGMELTFKSHQANSGAVTITVVGASSLGPTALQMGGSALSGAEIASGSTVKIVYDGTAWQLVSVSAASGLSAYLAKAGGTMTGDLTMSGASIVEAEGAAVASASSTNIWATDGNTVHVTGNTGIADFATAPQAGAWMKVIFDGTPVLTQSANLNLNAGGSNVTVAAGDIAFVYADTTTQMDVVILRKSGAPLALADASVTAAKLDGGQTGSAPIYGCRAWANMNGTGTPALRASGNVTSITDHGTGEYSLNFTTAMPDANYAVIGTSSYSPAAVAAAPVICVVSQTTSAVRFIVTRYTDGAIDTDYINIVIFR